MQRRRSRSPSRSRKSLKDRKTNTSSEQKMAQSKTEERYPSTSHDASTQLLASPVSGHHKAVENEQFDTNSSNERIDSSGFSSSTPQTPTNSNLYEHNATERQPCTAADSPPGQLNRSPADRDEQQQELRQRPNRKNINRNQPGVVPAAERTNRWIFRRSCLLFVLVTIGLVVLFSLIYLVNKSDDNKTHKLETFLQRLRETMPNLPDGIFLYLKLEIETTVFTQSQRGPGKLTIVFDAADEKQRTRLKQLLGEINEFGDTLNGKADDSGSKRECLVDLSFNGATSFVEHDTLKAAELQDKYHGAYGNGSRVMVICGVDSVGNQTVRVLHGIADDQYPPHNDVLLVTTVAVTGLSIAKNGVSNRKAAELLLHQVLEDRVGRDEGPALLARMGNAVLFANFAI